MMLCKNCGYKYEEIENDDGFCSSECFEEYQWKHKRKEKGLLKKDWKCPSCKSNSIALNVEIDHQHFEDQFRKIRQLIRCCNCQSTFIFEYELKNIKIQALKKEY